MSQNKKTLIIVTRQFNEATFRQKYVIGQRKTHEDKAKEAQVTQTTDRSAPMILTAINNSLFRSLTFATLRKAQNIGTAAGEFYQACHATCLERYLRFEQAHGCQTLRDVMTAPFRPAYDSRAHFP